MSKHINVRIYGRVQMVMFRDSVRRKARKLGVAGFVQNEKDGSVYIEAEGDEDALKEFLKWCHKGSVLSDVERVDVSVGALSDLRGFEIRY